MSYTISISPGGEFVEYTGRWNVKENRASATATGSSFRVGFSGSRAMLSFDISKCLPAYPHIYISVDGGAKIETAVSELVRIYAVGDGEHEVKVIIKSSLETQDRWDDPVAEVAFLGCVDTVGAKIKPDTRKIIEFVGDSITEGSSIYFPEYDPIEGARWVENLVYMNDVLADYSYKTAELLDMRSVFMGYGLSGLTVIGGGGIPRGADAYPYVSRGVKYTGKADIVVINYGANDRKQPVDEVVSAYKELLRVVREHNPEAVIYSVSPYCKAFAREFEKLVLEYNSETGDGVIFVNTTSWGVPEEPIHPKDYVHTVIAEKLSEVIRSTYDK